MQYTGNENIVFDYIYFLHIFCYFIARCYDLLARHFVELAYPGAPKGR